MKITGLGSKEAEGPIFLIMSRVREAGGPVEKKTFGNIGNIWRGLISNVPAALGEKQANKQTTKQKKVF